MPLISPKGAAGDLRSRSSSRIRFRIVSDSAHRSNATVARGFPSLARSHTREKPRDQSETPLRHQSTSQRARVSPTRKKIYFARFSQVVVSRLDSDYGRSVFRTPTGLALRVGHRSSTVRDSVKIRPTRGSRRRVRLARDLAKAPLNRRLLFFFTLFSFSFFLLFLGSFFSLSAARLSSLVDDSVDF